MQRVADAHNQPLAQLLGWHAIHMDGGHCASTTQQPPLHSDWPICPRHECTGKVAKAQMSPPQPRAAHDSAAVHRKHRHHATVLQRIANTRNDRQPCQELLRWCPASTSVQRNLEENTSRQGLVSTRGAADVIRESTGDLADVIRHGRGRDGAQKWESSPLTSAQGEEPSPCPSGNRRQAQPGGDHCSSALPDL